MHLLDFLKENKACHQAVKWVESQQDQSADALMASCPRGEWIIWAYQKAGYDFDILAPVVYAAVNRAIGYAADALDSVGVAHELRDHIVIDRETARDAARDASAYTAAAYAAYAAYAVAAYAVAAYAVAAARAAARAARAAYAAYAADAAYAEAAEHKQCADDCRVMLPKFELK